MLSRSDRFKILQRDKFTCRYCGRCAPEIELEVDHIISKKNGGSNEISNLVTACIDCNRGKRDSNGDLTKWPFLCEKTKFIYRLLGIHRPYEEFKSLIDQSLECLDYNSIHEIAVYTSSNKPPINASNDRIFFMLLRIKWMFEFKHDCVERKNEHKCFFQ